MLEVYWVCLIGGILFALVTIVFGEVLGDFFDGLLDGMFESFSVDHLDFLHPMVLIGGITVFGGAGILLTKYTDLKPAPTALLCLMLAVALSIVIYLAYVKPMKNSENSTGYSMKDLEGKICEVTVSIPPGGYGEVLLKVGAGNTNHIAATYEQAEIPAGSKVVVGEVKEGVLYVLPYET